MRAGAGEHADLGAILDCLCVLTVRAHRVAGTAVTLMTPTTSRVGQVVAGACNDRTRAWQELQLTLGEGPGIDAFEEARPVVVRDIAEELHRWPGWVPEARRLGVGATMSVPLVLGASRFGVLTVYDVRRHPFDAALQVALDDVADVATAILLDSVGLEDGDPARIPGLLDVLGVRAEVYQAQGMVMAQLEVTLGEALALMRAHAFATGTSLTAVAVGVLDGEIELGRTEEP